MNETNVDTEQDVQMRGFTRHLKGEVRHEHAVAFPKDYGLSVSPTAITCVVIFSINYKLTQHKVEEKSS